MVGALVSRLWFGLKLMLEAVMAVFLLSMAVITAIDVVGRYFFSAPLPGGYEIVQYLMALSVFAALPLATRAEGHLTIELLTGRLRGRMKRFHRITMLVVITLILAFLAWRMGAQASSLQRGATVSGSLRIPLAPLAWIMTALAWLSVLVSAVQVGLAAAGHESEKKPTEGMVE